ncbi:MAG: tRNA(His) guanylyltransferase Thg1 family protein [Candidatus Berkiella sp.]
MSNDSLGDRMKSYEDAFRTHLPIRMPVILRIDGKAFHSYTKGCQRPYDQNLVDVMNDTAKYLCEHVQGTQIAYVQSDEISLFLNNYKDIDTQSWFDNNLQKIVSVSAAMASSIFTSLSWKVFDKNKDKEWDYLPYTPEDIKPAFFDSRAWVVPEKEVCNYFLWRQQDATRNSVQMLARSLYSHKECTDKNNSELQEMCFQKGFNWNDLPTSQKRGRCIVKKTFSENAINKKTGETIPCVRSRWVVDNEIPIFSQNREYINQYVFDADDDSGEA